MDIPALSMALSQNQIMNDVGVALLSKSLDNMEDAGAAMVATIDAAPSSSSPLSEAKRAISFNSAFENAF